jgi:hypothetical protein
MLQFILGYILTFWLIIDLFKNRKKYLGLNRMSFQWVIFRIFWASFSLTLIFNGVV